MKIIKEIIPFLIVIVVVLLVKTYIITPIKVNGSSMKNTLHDGDIMFLDKIGYKIGNIKRFDIVVVELTDDYIIKRVIGLPGEKIYCKDNKVYINGKYLKEKFEHGNTADFDEIELKENEYFVMGDNRANSQDSRFLGPIKKENIKGHAVFTIFPFNRIGPKK